MEQVATLRALIISIGLILCPSFASPQVLPSKINQEADMLLPIDDQDIQTVFDLLSAGYEGKFHKIIYRDKIGPFEDEEFFSIMGVDYLDRKGRSLFVDDAFPGTRSQKFKDTRSNVWEGLYAGGVKCTHLEIIFTSDGQYTINLGYETASFDPKDGFWPDDLSAETYTYSEGW